jgi:hypothetical protein
MLGQPTQHPQPKEYDAEMDEHTDGYVAFVMDEIARLGKNQPGVVVLVEQRVDYSYYAPEGFGTADCILMGNDEIHVIDFKYGQGVWVGANDNSQLKLYVLGALKTLPRLPKTVKMTIYQPRLANISTSQLVVEDLLEWGESIREKAKKAYGGAGDFHTGEHCKFCKVATTCRKRADENLRLAQLDFAEPPLLTDGEVQELLPKLSEFQAWAKNLFDYAEIKAKDGYEWYGFKLVEKQTRRKITDPTEAVKRFRTAGMLDLILEMPATLTAICKKLKGDDFTEILGDLIEKPKGEPTLVPNADKRPPYSSAVADFGGETE